MGRPASSLCHEARRSFENGLPIRVGDLGDQDVALGELIHVLRIGDVPKCPGRDPVTDGETFEQDRAGLGETIVAGHHDVGLAAVHRLGPGLDDEEFAGPTVLGPLDVHRRGDPSLRRVVLLDGQGPAGQLQHFVVGQAEAIALLGGRRTVHQTSVDCVVGHRQLLGTELAPHDGPEPRP